MLEPIPEQTNLRNMEPSVHPASPANSSKSSLKNVCRAENLNCDFSDDNVSDLKELVDKVEEYVCVDIQRDWKKWLSNFILEMFLISVIALVSLIFMHKHGCYIIL